MIFPNHYNQRIRKNLLMQPKNQSVMQVGATLKDNKWHDLTHWGLRASIGTIFIVHSLKKFDPSFQGWLVEIGLPPEMRLPLALAEFLGGIFLITGILTRITGVIFSVILLGAIFHIRWENGFFISEGGWESGIKLHFPKP